MRSLARGVIRLEVLGLLEVEETGDNVGRHGFDGGVELQDHIIVELARVGDLVLKVLELGLQIHEVLVGLQLWICFSGGLKVDQRTGQLVFGGGTLSGGE